MHFPKKHWKLIYEYLFNEGVCVVENDPRIKTHPNIAEVTNLEVLFTMRVWFEYLL